MNSSVKYVENKNRNSECMDVKCKFVVIVVWNILQQLNFYIGVQYSIGIIIAKGHELDTWYVNKNANEKWYDPTLGPKGNEVITITCYTHTHDMSRKHSCYVNYKRFNVVNPIQMV
jgi:hypothetical protein